MLIKEIEKKSTSELNDLISDLKAQLFMLRFQNSTRQLEQTHKIKLVKKDIARVFTVLNLRQNQPLEQSGGTNKDKTESQGTKTEKPEVTLKAKVPVKVPTQKSPPPNQKLKPEETKPTKGDK